MYKCRIGKNVVARRENSDGQSSDSGCDRGIHPRDTDLGQYTYDGSRDGGEKGVGYPGHSVEINAVRSDRSLRLPWWGGWFQRHVRSARTR